MIILNMQFLVCVCVWVVSLHQLNHIFCCSNSSICSFCKCDMSWNGIRYQHWMIKPTIFKDFYKLYIDFHWFNIFSTKIWLSNKVGRVISRIKTNSAQRKLKLGLSLAIKLTILEWFYEWNCVFQRFNILFTKL